MLEWYVVLSVQELATFEHEPNVYSKYAFDQITNEFTLIGESITMYTSKTNLVDAARITGSAGSTTITANINFSKLTATDKTFQIVDYSITECSSIIPCFGIEDNIYSSLVQRYADPTHPLTFPTQTLSVYTKKKNAHFDYQTKLFWMHLFCLKHSFFELIKLLLKTTSPSHTSIYRWFRKIIHFKFWNLQ